jgi:micrococcal nuclease
VQIRRLLPLLVLLAAAVLAIVSGAQPSGPGGSAGAVVTRVVDGDTVEVSIDGRLDKLRYIGIDTPESVKPGTPVECFAKAASKQNRRLIEGRRVKLRFDVERRDRYGRLLAYVYRAHDGLFVNAELVLSGFAHTLTIPPNVAHADEFARLARAAREARRGLWRAC